MMEVEISRLDLRYEHIRLRNERKERNLLPSLQAEGFFDSLGCIFDDSSNNSLILIDGFKRYRCAKRLKIQTVPVVKIGRDHIAGLLKILRNHEARTLAIVEQAAMLNELHSTHGLSVSEIARRLERSPSWVSIRLQMLNKMSPIVTEAVFSGKFPLRSYLYTLKPFTRVKGVSQKQVDEFVEITSGKNLSTRDLQTLATAFFKGNEELRTQIREGQLDWSLQKLKQSQKNHNENTPSNLNQYEKAVHGRLNIVRGIIERLNVELFDERLCTPDFFLEAGHICKSITQMLPRFESGLQSIYDR
jgi:predicted transcriptional regulator